MIFSDIYQHVIPFWEIEIDFSDGETILFEEDEDGFSSDRFAALWNRVEKEVGYENSFYELMVWTMYQVFHKRAQSLFTEGIHYLRTQEIDPWEIEEQYFINLSEPIWKKELAQYQRV